MAEPAPAERIIRRGRRAARRGLARLRAKSWQVGQAAAAAGAAWWIAKDVLGHPQPLFAPIVAVVCLGTSYAQRLRRVAEATIGVTIGILLAEALVRLTGTGPWQLVLAVGLSMAVAVFVNAGALLVTQAGVQAIVVLTIASTPRYGFTRWVDALVGGGVALVAATVVPRAPLRRPREQAATVVRRIASLLRAAAESVVDGDSERAARVLAEARSAQPLIRELQAAADEGMSVVAASPFRRRQAGEVRRVSELVEPLERALGNTRLLVRRVAVAARRNEPMPRSYAALLNDLADATEEVAAHLARDEMPNAVRPRLLAIGHRTAEVERGASLSADVVLAQIRSIVVDLLQLTGLDNVEATGALPPLPHP